MIKIAVPQLDHIEIESVTEVLKSGVIAQGQIVKNFENIFAKYIGTKHAIAVNSGTSALQTALLAHGIGKGDEVITTSFSFIATANSIVHAGARPVFVDISENDFNIDPEQIVEKITHKTKAIIPVHLYGQSANMKAIMEIAEDYNLFVIEDACQAHGAEFSGKKVGSFGTGCFSFYPTKNMTTGEGGIILTNDDNIANRARMIRNHGSQQRYYHEINGYNFRMTDIAASIGIVQVTKLEGFNKKRIENAKFLTGNLKTNNNILTPKMFSNRKHVFNQYTIRILETDGLSREKLAQKLNNVGIETGIYYPIPIHKQQLYKEIGYSDILPVSDKMAKEVISLPVHPSLSKDDLEKIVNEFNYF